MIRTRIRLTEDQAKALKEIAAQRGISMAELIRESVAHLIEDRSRMAKWRRALAIMGRYRSGRSDVSTDHDEYLMDECR